MVVGIQPLLRPFRCGNPECPSWHRGQGQIILRGQPVVGFVAEGRCPHCKAYTLVRVTESGVEYSVRTT